MVKTIKLIFFGISLLFFLITAVHFFLFERDAPVAAAEHYHQSVQVHVTESIVAVTADLASISLSLPVSDGELSFENLPESVYPYYIFQEGVIKYWSDNAFVPEFEQINNLKSVDILTVSGGHFVAVRTPMGNAGYFCVSLIPISRRTSSTFTDSQVVLNITPDNISNKQNNQDYEAITSTDNTPIFYVKTPKSVSKLRYSLSATTLMLLSITFLFFIAFCVLQAGEYIKKHQFGRSFIVISLILLFIRLLLLLNNNSFLASGSIVFDEQDLNNSRWEISIGDRLANGFILVILFGFLASYFYRSTVYYYVIKSKQLTRSFFAVSCVVLFFLVSYALTKELCSILVSSNGLYNYGLTTSFDSAKIALFVYFILLSVTFFLVSHCLIYIFSKLFPQKVKGILHWLYGFILSFILLAVLNDLQWLYFIVAVYFLLVYHFQLARSFYVFRFKTSLYFFLSAFVFATLGTIVLHQYVELEKRNNVQEISRSVFMKNDLVFEKFITAKINDIKADESIKDAIVQPTLGWERVTQKVKENHLNDLVNSYKSNIYVFDSAGESLDILPDSKSLDAWKIEFDKPINLTSKSGIFKAKNSEGDFSFYGIAPIKSGNENILGTVLIELSYPLLTQNVINFKEFQRTPQQSKDDFNEYSLAVIDKGDKLLSLEGSFNYIDKWHTTFTQSLDLFTSGITYEGFWHYGVKNSDGKILIVSLPNNDLLNDWANLSFLFLISVFAISFILVIYSFRHGYSKRSQMNFTTRIQLYLNTAFLLPLLLILIIAISVVGTTLRKNQENGFRENTASLASTVQFLASDLFAGRMSRAYFEQELDGLAQNAKVGFSIYDQSGKKDYTASADFESLPNYLNPVAFINLITKNERQLLLGENYFGENHLTSYVSVQPQSGNQKLIVGIPHVDSGVVLNRQLITVISSILNIFIFLFVFLLIAAFFVSRQLTNPIRTVTGHLRKTNLDKLDEPLPMEETNDEMGVLVRAYNRMLQKLEESKMALSDSEKQTAWREMAKQVAHEIKNPLTPMKLSIQQLQRTLPLDNPKSKQRIERALNSLNEQIDNISEIANSFSEFAKMPVPRSEEFDLVEVIQKVTDLYTTNKNSDFHLHFLQPKLLVRGDRQLMSRVLTNLIINGLQSVPIDKRPKIEISAYKNEEDSFAIVEVKDNGAGVPEEIHEKVFIPNFSTKVGGSGLGLALAKRGIEHGGGNIWFDTEAGIGTTFYVDLPMAR